MVLTNFQICSDRPFLSGFLKHLIQRITYSKLQGHAYKMSSEENCVSYRVLFDGERGEGGGKMIIPFPSAAFLILFLVMLSISENAHVKFPRILWIFQNPQNSQKFNKSIFTIKKHIQSVLGTAHISSILGSTSSILKSPQL